MNWKNTRAGYGALPIALHWLMLLLAAGTYAAMELRSIFPRGSPEREAMASWHYRFGLSVFMLVWLRLLARLQGVAPVVEPALPARQAASARSFKKLHEAGAALYHHYVRRDNTLKLMVPAG